MRDIQFKNRAEVKWFDTYDSYFIESNVSTDAGAELDLGSTEVLAGKSITKSKTSGLLSLGLVEILASAIPSISIGVADLYLGYDEILSSKIDITSIVTTFITMGVAEGLSSTSNIQSISDSSFSLGISELLGSTSISISLAESEITLGIETLMTSRQNIITKSSIPVLVLGQPEALYGKSLISSSLSGFIILGKEESAFSDCNITSFNIGELTLGVVEYMSSTTVCESYGSGILSTGIIELLGSTSTIISIATNLSLDLGQNEHLTNSVFINTSVSTTELLLGRSEELSSSINIELSINVGLTLGIIEILGSAIPSTSVAYNSILTLGTIEYLASTSLVKSNISSFIILGTTELLSSKIHAVSFIRKGGAWSTITIGHVELLAHKAKVISIVNHTTLVIGIVESLTYINHKIQTNVSGVMLLGVVELLSSAIASSISSYEAELTLGTENELSSTININSSCSSFMLFGEIESLSSSINITSAIHPNLIKGKLELLASTVFSISITDSDIVVGGSEILSGSSNIQSYIYSVLVTGIIEELSSTIEGNNFIGNWDESFINKENTCCSTKIEGSLLVGEVEVLSASRINASTTIATLHLGQPEHLSSHVSFSNDIDSILILGVNEKLRVTSEIISTTSNAELTIGIVENLTSNSISESISDCLLTTGLPEELSGTTYCYSDTKAIIGIGLIEVLLSTSGAITTSSASTLLTGQIEILASSTFSITVLNSYLKIGIIEQLSSTANVDSLCSGNLIEGWTELIKAKSSSTSYIRKGGKYSTLILGIREILAGKSISKTGIREPSVILGISEPLAFTHYHIGSSECNALLTTGKVEILGVSETINSAVASDLTIGSIEDLSSLTNIETNTNADISFGVSESLSAFINITSKFESSLIIGVVELLGSTIVTSSSIILDIFIGSDESLFASSLIQSDISTILTLGIANQIKSSLHITTYISSDVHLGITELISGWSPVSSIVNFPSLILGVNELMSSHPYIETNVKGRFNSGILEVLGAATSSHSIIPGNLTLGIIEDLDAVTTIETSVYADITLGDITVLSGSITITPDIKALLLIGEVEILSNANFSISILDSYITLGIEESLEYTTSIEVNVEADLTLGVYEYLSSTENIITNVIDASLSVGLIEVLATSNFSITITEADLSFGEENPLKSHIYIQSYLNNASLLIGTSELLASILASTAHFPPAELTLGVGEILSSTAIVQNTVSDVLNLGGQENLSSSISYSNLVENTIDLVIGGPVPISGKAKAKVNARGLWLYVPGMLEELESSILITSSIPISKMFRDKELMTSTNAITSTISLSSLSIGVVEIVATSNFSVSTTAASLALGVGYILNSSGTTISNVVAGEISLGQDEELSVSECFIQSYVPDIELIVGVVELIASSVFSISVIDVALLRGRIEVLSSKSKTVSKTKAFLNIPGTLELLEASFDIKSVVKVGTLDVGYISLPGATSIITTFADASIDTGNSEELEARPFITSKVDSYISLGISTESSGNCIVISNVNDTELDKPIVLESAISIITYATTEIYLGDFEEILGVTNISSSVEGLLIIGDVTELSSTSVIEISIEASYLINPVIWIYSSSYSAWNKAVSMVRAGFLDINGSIILSASSYTEAIVDASIIYGEQAELSGIGIIQSFVTTPQLTTGIVELLSISNFSISVTDAKLISPVIYLSSDINIQTNVNDTRLVGPEHLFGSSLITTNTIGNIVEGRVELISVKEDIVSFINDVELNLGTIEELSSSVVIETSTTIPEIIYNVFLHSFTDYVWNKAVSRASATKLVVYNGFFSSTCSIFNSVAYGINLTIGITEELASSVHCLVEIPDSLLKLGIPLELIAHTSVKSYTKAHLDKSDLAGSSLFSSEVWSTMLMGVAEQIGTGKVKIKSNVRSETLMIGGLDFYVRNIVASSTKAILGVNYHLHSKSNAKSSNVANLSTGLITTISSKINVNSLVTSNLTLGKETSISSTSKSRFRVSGFITIGVEHSLKSKIYTKTYIPTSFLFVGDKSSLFSQTHSKSIINTSYLNLGIAEVLSSTVNSITVTKPLQLIIGSSELVSSISISNSIADAFLDTGGENVISGKCATTSSSSGHLLTGIIETLTTTVNIESYTVLTNALYNNTSLTGKSHTTSNTSILTLILGVLTPLTAKSESKTNFVVEYISGNVEKLFSKVFVKSYCESTLFIGYAERLASSVIVISHINDLEFGETIEPISSTVNIKSSINAFINIGITERLTATNNIVLNSRSTDIKLGIIETLSSNVLLKSQCNSGTIQLEIEHNSRGSVHSFIPNIELVLGKVEELSGTSYVKIDSTIEALIYGAHEILSAKAKVISNIPLIRLLMGYPEGLTGFTTTTSFVLTSDLESETYIKHKRKITAVLQTTFNKFSVDRKTLNLHQTPFPNASNQDIASFIDLLLNDDYNEQKYRYLYREVINKNEWPEDVRCRLMLDPDNARYFVVDGDDPKIYNLNIYNIQPHDLIMLDRLLVYRLEPHNATLAGINYKTLSTSLSKMIYIYLELKLTGNYSKYNNSAIFTHKKNALETCYENHLTQTVFGHVSSKGT